MYVHCLDFGKDILDLELLNVSMIALEYKSEKQRCVRGLPSQSHSLHK
jgi:hypothetical protein